MGKQKVKRSPINSATLGANDIASMVANARAGANKVLPVGPQLRTPAGATQVQGFTANTAALPLPPGTSLALFNNSATVAWVTMNKAADGALVAPTGIANAIPLKPNDWTYLNMGENDQIQTSAATVGCYIIEDDTSFQIIPEDKQF